MRRRGLIVALALGALVLVLVASREGTEPRGHGRPIPALRGNPTRVGARLQPLVDRVAGRVERLRGLEFDHVPTVRLVDKAELLTLGRRLARRARRHSQVGPARARRERHLRRANIRFDQLAGLLPPEISFGPDATGGLDRVGGAYDYAHGHILLIPGLIATRDQLLYTLAHELTHALEDENFRLHFPGLTRPGEAAIVRRAVVEGTATLIQDRYRHRYLGDMVPIAQRLEGARSVIAAGPAPYAVNAQGIFDYVDGALFIRSLHRRGGWAEVNRAIAHPPRSSRQILHPRRWPGSVGGTAVRLGVGRLLRDRWRFVGGGEAGEEDAIVILLAGSIQSEALTGAAGWDGGRFALWRPRTVAEGCRPACAEGDVGVVAFHWQRRGDADQFELTVPAYMIAGLLAERVDDRTWKLGDGYAAVASAPRTSALAFAPEPGLADRLADRAAQAARRG